MLKASPSLNAYQKISKSFAHYRLIHFTCVTGNPKSTGNTSFIQVKFIPYIFSLQFLQSSLQKLASDLRNDGHDFKMLETMGFFDKSNKHRRRSMLFEKFPYCYDFCQSFSRMLSTTELPERKEFFSLLSNQTITQEQYNFTKKLWAEYGFANLLEFSELYCK